MSGDESGIFVSRLYYDTSYTGKSSTKTSDGDDGILVYREYFSTSLLALMLMKAFVEARKNKRHTRSEWNYEKYALLYIWASERKIRNKTYRPGRSRAFIEHHPVDREIFAAIFQDRLIHHLLYNMTADWWDKRFIYDSYSCRKGKGTHLGVKRTYQAMAKASKNFKKKQVWVCKLDLQGYFMSLPRKKIYERAVWGLEQQFPPGSWEYNLCRFLWKVVIFDDPVEGVKIKGSKSDWDCLPKSKSLFNAPKGHGIVIGNLTSQLLSNIYLDLLDRYMKFDLGYEYYGRYVDDFWFMGERDRLKADIEKIRVFLDGIGLKLHPKKIYLQPIERGLPFLGAVIYPHRIVPGRRIKMGFNQSAADAVAGIPGALESLQSYLGLMMHYRSAKIRERAFRYTGLDGTAP